MDTLLLNPECKDIAKEGQAEGKQERGAKNSCKTTDTEQQQQLRLT
jgi:hypothetical protein